MGGSDVEDVVDDIVGTVDDMIIDLDDATSFQQQILEWLDKVKIKWPRMLFIFIEIISFILSPIQVAIYDEVLDLIKDTSTPVIEQAQITNHKKIERKIKIEVNNTLNINIESKDTRDELLGKFGYVSTDNLIIRQTNRIKSKALHTLEFGQVVEITKKKRNWTKIQYENDEDFIEGRVFTRYISNFRE